MATDAPRRGLDTASAVVEGAADGLADGIEREHLGDSLPHLAGETASIAQRNSRSQRLRARLERADEKVDAFLDRTKGKARALAESARRVRRAPPQVANEARLAGKAWASGLAAGLALRVAAGVVLAVAFTVFTVGLVQALNGLWGAPWGTFAVAALYTFVGFAVLGAAKGKADAGRRAARVHLERARAEVRRVAQPLRDAFAGAGGAAGAGHDPTDALLDPRHEVELPRMRPPPTQPVPPPSADGHRAPPARLASESTASAAAAQATRTAGSSSPSSSDDPSRT